MQPKAPDLESLEDKLQGWFDELAGPSGDGPTIDGSSIVDPLAAVPAEQLQLLMDDLFPDETGQPLPSPINDNHPVLWPPYALSSPMLEVTAGLQNASQGLASASAPGSFPLMMSVGNSGPMQQQQQQQQALPFLAYQHMQPLAQMALPQHPVVAAATACQNPPVSSGALKPTGSLQHIKQEPEQQQQQLLLQQEAQPRQVLERTPSRSSSADGSSSGGGGRAAASSSAAGGPDVSTAAAPAHATTAAAGKPVPKKRIRKNTDKLKQQQLQEKVQEMAQQLDRLQLENETARIRNQVLERLVSSSEEQIQTIHRASSSDSGSLAAAAASAAGLRSGPAAGTMPGLLGMQQQLAAQQHQQQLQQQGDSRRRLHFTAPQKFAECWRQLVSELSHYLVLADGPAADPAAVQQILLILKTIDEANRSDWQLRPGALMSYHCLNLETLLHDEVPDSHWQSAVLAISLSREQIKVVATAHQLQQRLMARASAERAQILQQISIERLTRSHVMTNEIISPPYLQTITRLKALMSHYAMACNRTVHLHVMVFERVMSPVQFAKLVVHCYPYLPAGECIMRECARLADAQLNSQRLPSPMRGTL